MKQAHRTLTLDAPFEQVREWAELALTELGGDSVEFEAQGDGWALWIHTKMNRRTYGELVSVHLDDAGGLNIESTSRARPPIVTDWGRNRANVDYLANRLQELGETPA